MEAQAIATALHVNHTLTALDLSRNQIGAVGAQAIATALHINRTLTTLDLSSNWIGAVGAQDIATSLHVNHTLTTLDLNGNGIGAIGAQDIEIAMEIRQKQNHDQEANVLISFTDNQSLFSRLPGDMCILSTILDYIKIPPLIIKYNN